MLQEERMLQSSCKVIFSRIAYNAYRVPLGLQMEQTKMIA